MKKLFILILFLFTVFAVSAQDFEFIDSVNISSERWRDSLLRMDKSQIPTGFLFEYSLAGIDLSKFNGVNSDTLKNEGLILSLHEILNLSKVNSNAQIAPTDDLYNQAKSIYKNNKTVALIFIYQNYNRIRQSALSEGLFTIASDSVGILDAPGRTISPYDTYEVFAFAPFKQTITQFNSINFTLPNELFYMQGFTSVEVDFGDGAGYRTLNKGGSIAIYYGTEGIKNLTARITTTNGVRIAKSQIDYKRPLSYSEPDSTFSIEVEPLYSNDDDYFGTYNRNNTLSNTNNVTLIGANVEIVNGCGNVFDKPIIIVEGFDPLGDFDIENYTRRFGSAQFAITMSNYGYDFVYVDFTDNTTYIENNAKVLEAVINKVNEMKVGANKSSIIGFSMGGLIARWCLKDMEDRSLDHQVENYFSYDAPHQGANSPLGMQYISQELERDLPYLRFDKTFRKTLDGLRSKAARQMLVTHGGYDNAPFNWQPSLETLDPLRASFAQKLVAKGYPQTTNNYGIAFGRGNNTNNKDAGNGMQWTPANPFNAGDQIFEGGITFVLVNVTTDVWAVSENNTKTTIGQYKFGGYTFRKIFGIPFPFKTIRKREFKYRSTNSYDDAPGGFDETQRFVQEGWESGWANSATTFGHDGHCFLPTVSALDLQNQTYGAGSKWQSNNLFYNIDNQIQNIGTVTGNDLITPSLSPFKAVITASTGTTAINEEHNGNINARFAAFIQRKILNAIPINCGTICNDPIEIQGLPQFCTAETYTIQNLPVGATVNWSINPSSGVANISVSGNTATLTKTGNGNVQLSAVVSSQCGSINLLPINISVGLPVIGEFLIEYNVFDDLCRPQDRYTIAAIPGATYQWSVNNSKILLNQQAGNSCLVYGGTVAQGTSEDFELTVTVTNSCGTATNTYLYGYYYRPTREECLNNQYSRMVIYPNPVSDEITIEYSTLQEGENLSKIGQTKDVKLYNQSGEILLSSIWKENEQKLKLETKNIPDGTYYLHITEGKETIKKQIIIKH